MNPLIEGMQMKRAILLILASLLISSAALAQLPPIGYMWFFAHDQRFNYFICSFPEPYIAKVEMYIWCLPSDHGNEIFNPAIGSEK